MLGNTFGRIFQITTCGESYGWHAGERGEGWGGSLLTIVNGVPPGIKLDLAMIQHELDKRRPGQSEIDSPRKETDRVEIVSGLEEGAVIRVTTQATANPKAVRPAWVRRLVFSSSSHSRPSSALPRLGPLMIPPRKSRP